MSDLQKFIRQQFFDSHWTRDVDPASLTEEKLASLDTSFSHIDVKSKLCLLLAFSNAKPNISPTIDKHVESIFLQALDEENNLVKAVATILHTKQSLGYLNFDISPTNEAFKKNLEKLLKVSDRWCVVDTPLLAEYLGDNVLNPVTTDSSPSRGHAAAKRPHPSSTYRKRTTRVLGFRPRGKPESVAVKEAYLEKLKDECQRRRVHVPIPGRSFARQDEADETSHTDSSGFMGSSNANRRDSHLTPSRKGTLSHSWNRPSDSTMRKPPPSWPRANTDLPERTGENRPISLTERLAARSAAAANFRKPSGIKLLDFDQLPAFGPKAKQLRKEQIEKEREMKKLEKEERLKEQKAAREAAKLARQTERQALLEARRHNSVGAWAATPVPNADAVMPNPGADEAAPNFSTTVPTVSNHQVTCTFSDTTDTHLQKPFGLAPTPNASNFMVRHPLLSATIGLPTTTGASMPARTADEDEDDDDEEDDDDDMMLRDPGTGLYKLGIARDFRGFNPTARVNLQGNSVTQVITSSTQSGFFTRYSVTPQSSVTNFVPPNMYPLQSDRQLEGFIPSTTASTTTSMANTALHLFQAGQLQQQQHEQQQQQQLQLSTPVPIANNTASSIAQNPTTTHISVAPTIKVVGGVHAKPFIRIIQPSPATPKVGANLSTPTQQATAPNSTLQALVSAPNPLLSSGGQLTYSVTDTNHMVVRAQSTIMLPQTEALPQQQQQQQPNLSPPFSTSLPTSRPQPVSSSSTPVRIAPRPARLVRVTTPSALSELRPRQPNSGQPRLVSIAPASRLAYITQQPQQPQQSQQQQTSHLVDTDQSNAQPTPLSPPTTRSMNPTWTVDGRSVILAPVITMPGSQSPPKIGLLSPPSQSTQTCPTTGYIQFVRQAPTVAVPTGVQTIRVVQQQQQPQSQQQPPQPVELEPSGQMIVHTTTTMEQNQMNTYSGGMLETSTQPSFMATHMSQPVSSPLHPTQLGVTLTTANPNGTGATLPSAVKIQDDLCLTEAQVNSVHNLFQGANRVSRPEKAMIVSFIAGARGNPHPEAGNTLRIRLSEYRERVLNQATGQLMDVAADTYLHMDYSTGKCEKVKYYRNEPPEVLLRLPVQPALH